jgi:hypothetical protein
VTTLTDAEVSALNEALTSAFVRDGPPPPVNPRPEIVSVLRNPQPASQQRHLSAAQRRAKQFARGDDVGGGHEASHRHERV